MCQENQLKLLQDLQSYQYHSLTGAGRAKKKDFSHEKM